MNLLASTEAGPGDATADRRQAHRRARARGADGRLGGGGLTGLGHLLLFMLRRDRLRMPIWVLSLTALTAYFANAIALVMDADTLQTMTVFAKNPVMGLITGPGYGLDDITVPRFIVGMYAVFLMIGIGLMSITTVTRHTRAEEQTGRAELIRANVTGRHAQLFAAVILTVIMNVVAGALMAAALQFSEADPDPATSSLLFGAGMTAVGCVFVGVTSVTVQLTGFSRAASGMAGAVLALSFVVRGLGDMSAVAGGDLDWLSWLSPLGWSQQTAPFTLDRWWPLLYSAAAFVVLLVIGLAVQSRRDLGAGITAERPGRAHAGRGLSTAFGLAFRLQRSTLFWWSLGILVMAAIFGSFAGAMAEGADGMPEQITQLMGGPRGIVDGYLGYMALYMAMIVAAFALITVGGLRSEEQDFHTEPVLATAVSRGGWMASWVTVTLLGSAWLMLLAGIGEGIGAAASLDDWELLGPTVLGHLVQSAAVWVLIGLACLLYGFAPRLLGLTWIVFAGSAVLSLFGGLLQLDEAVLDLSVFNHIGQYPAEDISAEAVLTFLAITVVLVGAGMVGFRRRDLVTA